MPETEGIDFLPFTSSWGACRSVITYTPPLKCCSFAGARRVSRFPCGYPRGRRVKYRAVVGTIAMFEIAFWVGSCVDRIRLADRGSVLGRYEWRIAEKLVNTLKLVYRVRELEILRPCETKEAGRKTSWWKRPIGRFSCFSTWRRFSRRMCWRALRERCDRFIDQDCRGNGQGTYVAL
jgi:hypothetical protein